MMPDNNPGGPKTRLFFGPRRRSAALATHPISQRSRHSPVNTRRLSDCDDEEGSTTMTDVEAMVQRYYRDRPLLPRIEEALRADGVDPQTPSYRDLWPYDQLHSRGIVGTKEHAERAHIQPGMYVLDLGCGLGGTSRYLAAECGCRVAAIDLTPNFVEVARTNRTLRPCRPGFDSTGECARLAVPRRYLRPCLVVRGHDEHCGQGGADARGRASAETGRALLV